MNTTLTQLRQAVAALQSGKLAEAIRISQTILLKEPRNFDALHIVALASYHARDLDTAQRNVEKALAVRRDMPDAYNTHGLVLRARGRLDEAATQFSRALKLNARSREAHYNLANCCQDLGRLPEALQHYEAAIRLEPRMFVAWNNKALVLRRMGRPADALASFDEALRINRDFAPAHYNKADTLAAMQRLPDAVLEYDRAIALKPDFAEAHCNKGNALLELGRIDEALASYERAITLQPHFHQAFLSRGIALAALGRHAEAERSFREALALRPDYADAHYNLGRMLKATGRPKEALAAYDEAIRLRPDHAESFSNRGNALRELKLYDEALESFDRAIALRPAFAEALTNRGNVLKELGRLEDALASHDRALAIKADFAEAHVNRGNALKHLGRTQDALASYDRAIVFRPDYAEAYSNRGDALKELDRLDDALASFDRAVDLRPDDHVARYNKSLVSLQQHDFTEGFALHQSRWLAEDFDGRAPETAIPVWDGSSQPGEVLLWGEQGIGDEVFYASMLSLLDTRSQGFALSADKRLHPIYARSFPGFRLIDRVFTTKTIEGDFAAQVPIGNLGHLLHVDAARIAARRYPYLIADEDRKARIRAENPVFGKVPVCGISWKSGNKTMGGSRSIGLPDLAPLLTLPGFSFVNLQYGDVAADIQAARDQLGVEVQQCKGVDVFSDIDGLLALIDQCDVVFTIDNVTAHLAGAVGKKSVVMVPTGRGRYWYWGGEDPSLWYPSLRLVYQKKLGEWADVIGAAARLLADISATER